MPIPLFSATVLRVRPAGVTGDFCPVCRQERRFQLAIADHRRVILLMDRGRVGHEYHELTCKSCGCKMQRSPAERPLQHLPAGSAAELFEPECLPIVRRRIEDCTRMEAARKAGKLKPDTREEMIRHSIHCFARLYDEQPTARVTPLASGLLLAATVALGVLAAFFWITLRQMAIVLAIVACILTLWSGLWYTVISRSPRQKVRTWLAMSLAPLDPTEAEIRQARRELQTVRMGAGFKMRPAKVREKIERIRRSGMVAG
jgi:hypothetical protein